MTNKIKPFSLNYLSASKLYTWETCKNQFYLAYLNGDNTEFLSGDNVLSCEETLSDKADVSDSIYFVFGHIVHKVLELFWKGNSRNYKTLKKLYRDCYIEEGLNDPYYYNLGFVMIKDYFFYILNEAPKRKFIGAEVAFDFVVGTDKGREIRAKGSIDSVFYLGNGIYEIVDYKTSNYLPSQDEVDCNNQVALYDLAFRDSDTMSQYYYNGIKPKHIILTMHYLKHGSDGVIQTQLTKEDRDLNRRYFIDSFVQMNDLPREKYTAELNKFCNYCDHCDKCNVYKDALENESLEFLDSYDKELFSDRIKAINELKARIKILENKVGEYSDDCDKCFKNEMKKVRKLGADNIIVDGREYYMTNYTKRYLLPAVTIKILDKAGLWNPKDFLSNIPVGKVEKICSKHPDVWEKIERKALKRYVGNVMLKSRQVN